MTTDHKKVSAEFNRRRELSVIIRAALVELRTTQAPFILREHQGRWFEVKQGKSKRICGAKKKDGTRCRSKSLHRGSKCKFHGGLSTGAKTFEGKARAIAAMRAGWVKWQTVRGRPTA